MVVKPYQAVPIQDCGEPLVAIPSEQFAFVEPHPYAVLGAPYGDRSPFYVRQGVLTRLQVAQAHLQRERPGWRIQIFDAYRPIAVQQFMVDYTFEQERRARGFGSELTSAEEALLWEQVHTFWAIPSHDPAMPPPHSTGAAVDVTLLDGEGRVVDMGSPIDEISERSFPGHFESQQETDEGARRFHRNRGVLRRVMIVAGFLQHPREWWHFSYGDQLWAWLGNEAGAGKDFWGACYGSVK